MPRPDNYQKKKKQNKCPPHTVARNIRFSVFTLANVIILPLDFRCLKFLSVLVTSCAFKLFNLELHLIVTGCSFIQLQFLYCMVLPSNNTPSKEPEWSDWNEDTNSKSCSIARGAHRESKDWATNFWFATFTPGFNPVKIFTNTSFKARTCQDVARKQLWCLHVLNSLQHKRPGMRVLIQEGMCPKPCNIGYTTVWKKLS